MSGTEISIDFRYVMAEGAASTQGLTESDVESAGKRIVGPDGIHGRLQDLRRRGALAFADLPHDMDMLSRVQDLARSVRERFDHFVVLGIGGSALGARAMVEALTPAQRKPTFHVCDNLDPDGFAALLNQLDLKKTMFNVVSKSGGTLETMAQFWMVWNRMRSSVGDAAMKEHFVLTTDPRSGDLRAICNEQDLEGLVVPTAVGGRFSALSPVGLFPAAVAGVAVDELLAGARAMDLRCRRDGLWENPAHILALLTYLLDTRRGKSIAIYMPYADALDGFASWVCQLHAESLGKNGRGQTPVKARGATDQHSQLQLYLDGPKDKFFTLFEVSHFSETRALPAAGDGFTKYTAIQNIAGHSLASILSMECEATRQSLVEAGRPVVTLRLPSLHARGLGELMFLYEMSTTILGFLHDVDPFTQPAVEGGKLKTLALLNQGAGGQPKPSKYMV